MAPVANGIPIVYKSKEEEKKEKKRRNYASIILNLKRFYACPENNWHNDVIVASRQDRLCQTSHGGAHQGMSGSSRHAYILTGHGPFPYVQPNAGSCEAEEDCSCEC